MDFRTAHFVEFTGKTENVSAEGIDPPVGAHTKTGLKSYTY